MFERGNPYGNVDEDGHFLPLLALGIFVLAVAIASTIKLMDNADKSDSTLALSAQAASEIAPVAIKAAAGAGFGGPAGYVMGGVTIIEGLVITYDDLIATEEKDEFVNADGLKIKKGAYINENGNLVNFLYPEGVDSISVSTGSGWSNVKQRSDGTWVVEGGPDDDGTDYVKDESSNDNP